MSETFGFTPRRIDVGETTSVVVGTLGELCRVDSRGELISPVCQPFPAPVTSGVVLEDRWIGIWVEVEFQVARMAALPLDDAWRDGIGREELRTVLRNDGLEAVPAASIWSRTLDSEPMALTRVGDGFAFAVLGRGIYLMDADANEIWRAAIPHVGVDGSQRLHRQILEMFVIGDVLQIWMEDAEVYEMSLDDGRIIDQRVIGLSDRLEAVFHSKHLGWLLALSGGGIVRFESLDSAPDIHPTAGPVIDAVEGDSGWVWTGWRHDGMLVDDGVVSRPRRELGVAVLADSVLTNDGTWSACLV